VVETNIDAFAVKESPALSGMETKGVGLIARTVVVRPHFADYLKFRPTEDTHEIGVYIFPGSNFDNDAPIDDRKCQRTAS